MIDLAARRVLEMHYDAMWDNAFDAIAGGAIDYDPHLAAGPDRRRGLTLIARPGAALCAHFAVMLDRLTNVEPQQYRYPVADMHVTILPLFTATDNPAGELARLDDYRAAASAALQGVETFEIDFDGITLSRSAVMARGFPSGPALETLRERLRSQLRERGLDASLDQRYRLVTAHVSLFRFAAGLQDAAHFAALLEELRDEPFGTMHVEKLELVINDWYMSSKSLEQLELVPLTSAKA
jgi:2'-5' RNA ligase